MNFLTKYPYVFTLCIIILLATLTFAVWQRHETVRNGKELALLLQSLESDKIPVRLSDVFIKQSESIRPEDNGIVDYKKAFDSYRQSSPPAIYHTMKKNLGIGLFAFDKIRLSETELADLKNALEKMEPVFEHIRTGNGKKEFLSLSEIFDENGRHLYREPLYSIKELYNWYLVKIYLELQEKQYNDAYGTFLECLTFVKNHFAQYALSDGRKTSGDLLIEMHYLRSLGHLFRYLAAQRPPDGQTLSEITAILHSYRGAAKKSLELALILSLNSSNSREYEFVENRFGPIRWSDDLQKNTGAENNPKNIRKEKPEKRFIYRKNVNTIKYFRILEEYCDNRNGEIEAKLTEFQDSISPGEEWLIDLPGKTFIDLTEKTLEEWHKALQETAKQAADTATEAEIPQK